MTDEIVIVLWMMASGFIILGPLVYFFEITGAITGSIGLSIIWVALYSFVKGLASMYSVNSTGNLSFDFSIIIELVVCLALFVFISYGILQGKLLEQGKIQQNTGFIIWFVALVLIPTSMYAWEVIPNILFGKNNIRIIFSIDTHTSYPILVKEITFINSNNNKSSSFNFVSERSSKKNLVQVDFKDFKNRFEKSRRTLKTRHDSDRTFIPSGTDKFILSYYSFVDQVLYEDEFPLDITKLKIQDDEIYRPSGKYKTKIFMHVKLHIFPTGNAILLQAYEGKVNDIYRYNNIGTKIISEQESDELLDSYIEKMEFSGEKKNLIALFKYYQKNIIPEGIDKQLKFYNWNLWIRNEKEIKGLSLVDFWYRKYRLKNNYTRKHPYPLPIYVGFDVGSNPKYGFQYQIFFDEKNLRKFVSDLSDENPDKSVNIEIDFNENNPNQSNVFVILNENVIEFKSWEAFKIY